MASKVTPEARRVDHLFDAAEARFDRWRQLLKACQRWAAATGKKEADPLKATCAAVFGEILPVEDFFAYPGTRLLATLQDRIDGDDAVGATRLSQRISSALMLRSYRRDAAE
jgi:arginine decarboxylase